MFVSPWAHLLDTVPPFPRPHTLFLRLSGHWVAGQWWWWWGGVRLSGPARLPLHPSFWVTRGWPLGRRAGLWGDGGCSFADSRKRLGFGESEEGPPSVDDLAWRTLVPFRASPCSRARGHWERIPLQATRGGQGDPSLGASLPAHGTGAEEGQGSCPPQGGSLGFLRLAEDGGSSHPLVVKGFREYPARVSLVSSPPPSPS